MRQPIDKAHRVPQPAQVALTPAPIHYAVHLDPGYEVARGFLGECQVRPLGHLVGEVWVGLGRRRSETTLRPVLHHGVPHPHVAGGAWQEPLPESVKVSPNTGTNFHS